LKILVIDDDRNIAEAIALGFGLQWQECEVLTAYDGETGLNLFSTAEPDVVILDVSMPKMSGFDVLAQIREISDVPVLMLSAHAQEMEKVKGLELGADDYLTKPFSHIELFARVKAVLRRAQMPPPVSLAPSFAAGDLAINFADRSLTVSGQPVKLTPTEYSLLYHLVRNAGRVMPHGTLLAKVWGEEYREEIEYLKVYISRLRNKIGDLHDNPRYILTERGLGYRFMKPFGSKKKSQAPVGHV
jgi:DNA-binding response OmpR family regulator